MAEIVGGFLMPHDPLIPSITDAAEPAQRDRVLGAFEKVARRVDELDADTAITSETITTRCLGRTASRAA